MNRTTSTTGSHCTVEGGSARGHEAGVEVGVGVGVECRGKKAAKADRKKPTAVSGSEYSEVGEIYQGAQAGVGPQSVVPTPGGSAWECIRSPLLIWRSVASLGMSLVSLGIVQVVGTRREGSREKADTGKSIVQHI